MPEVTAIKLQEKKSQISKNLRRFNIFIDGNFAFAADEDFLILHQISIGKNISQDELQKYILETTLSKALNKVYGFLAFRARSEKEIRDYFKIKSRHEEFSDLIIEKVIESLKEKQFLDDKTFAQDWIDSRRRSKHKGSLVLIQELKQKGIDQEIIKEVISNQDRPDELELAIQAGSRKNKSLRNIDFLQAKQKLLGFLMRQGFSYSIALAAVAKILQKE